MIGFHDEPSTPAAGPALSELTERLFSGGGLLETALGLEHRPQQEAMARGVAAAMEANESLLVEAGTGVGKSLAYLLPGLLRATFQKRPLLISTATIALQEQIRFKDLPLCRKLLQSDQAFGEAAKFRDAILLGKANYLCRTRLAQAVGTQGELFPAPEQEELQRIIEWTHTTETGLRQELNPPPMAGVWEWINADSTVCNRHNCNPETCFYQRARATLQKADVIIVNHSLLFALISAGMPSSFRGPGILFPNDFLVIDEAHTVPEIATEHFGLRVSSLGLDRLLKALYNPKTKRGLFARHGGIAEVRLVNDALEAAEQFFTFIRHRLLSRRPEVRVREADWCDPVILQPLRQLADSAARIADRMEEGPARSEVQNQQNRLKGHIRGVAEMVSLSAEDHVHWVERSGRRGQIVNLRTAPLDVSGELRQCLFERETSAILTSATLAVDGRMDRFRAQTGADGVRDRVESSPFDYARNMRVYIARDVPLPTPGEARLSTETLADYILFCATRVAGGSLALFTSYADMETVARLTEEELRRAGRELLVQGREFSRTETANRFRKLGNAVLYGTESFWTGVDVPGPALSQVIITRLPFVNPTHPVAEAKCEWIREKGGNPFQEHTLPETLIQFRQGVGRLIRSKTDRGVITLLDSRVLVKTYGRLFTGSLPVRRWEVLTRQNREAVFRKP